MLPRKFLAFMLLVKMAVSQSVYPTTAVSYSTNSVPTIQTLPVSPTVSIIPSTVTPISSTVSAIPAKVSPVSATVSHVSATVVPMSASSATPVTVKAVPLSGSSTPIPCTPGAVKVTAMPSATSPSMSPIVTSQSSSSTSGNTEPKAYFLPATIPDPKVTILPHDTRTAVEVSCLYDDPYVGNVKDDVDGPMTPIKRITMACTDDFLVLNEEPLCFGIPKDDIKPTSVLKKGNKGNLNNPIDFEGLLDGFMSYL